MSQRWKGRPRLGSREGAAEVLGSKEVEDRLQALERRIDDLAIGLSVATEGRLLEKAALQVPKEPRLAFIQLGAPYGNVAALARAALHMFGEEHVLVVTRDESAASRWRREDMPAEAWQTDPGHARVWERVLTSSVSVFEHHLHWRENETLLLRALLAGSKKIQLWHGTSGAYAKEVALAALPDAPGMWEFADLTTTSVDIDWLVCEPRLHAARRRQFVFREYVADVDFRMVQPLARISQASRPEGRVLVAPTYPESPRAAEALVRRLRTYRRSSLPEGGTLHYRLHPWTPRWVSAELGASEIPHDVDLYESIETYDALVTDFSSLTSDFLLLGKRVVLDHSDAPEFLRSRRVWIDEALRSCCEVVDDPTDALRVACSPEDPLQEVRQRSAADRLASLGSDPGQPTLDLLARTLGTQADGPAHR